MQAYTAHQQHLILGKILGQGGEGRVFALDEVEQQHVVKIYHQLASTDKQAKLQAMVADNLAVLSKIALWPTELVYNQQQQIVGFVMPRLPVGSVAIHHLYNPSQRKQDFPKADYAFLVHAARNLAAAFAYLHSCGHCVGDVNQGNVVVAPDATITLIDCDSFQINHQGQTFACEVGVAHFTPPELHGQPFADVIKTTTHDNFGLAILIFHLLMMGRHPFAGVYLGEGEMPIEKAITEFRYAYSKNAQVKKIRPPPKAPSTAWLSEDIRELFEDAFDETIDKRPTAEQWLTALEEFGKKLKRCHDVKIHKYYKELIECPWCEFANKYRVEFFAQNKSHHSLEPVAELPSFGSKSGANVPVENSKNDVVWVWGLVFGIPTVLLLWMMNVGEFRSFVTQPFGQLQQDSFDRMQQARHKELLKELEISLRQHKEFKHYSELGRLTNILYERELALQQQKQPVFEGVSQNESTVKPKSYMSPEDERYLANYSSTVLIGVDLKGNILSSQTKHNAAVIVQPSKKLMWINKIDDPSGEYERDVEVSANSHTEFMEVQKTVSQLIWHVNHEWRPMGFNNWRLPTSSELAALAMFVGQDNLFDAKGVYAAGVENQLDGTYFDFRTIHRGDDYLLTKKIRLVRDMRSE